MEKENEEETSGVCSVCPRNLFSLSPQRHNDNKKYYEIPTAALAAAATSTSKKHEVCSACSKGLVGRRPRTGCRRPV
jgi:hypothetical protein